MFITLTLSPAIDCSLAVEDTLCVGNVQRVKSETRTPGGKGINVAKVLACNGSKVVAGGVLGEDMLDAYKQFLAAAGIDADFLTVPHPTRMNIMAVDGTGQEIKFNRPGFPDLDLDWDLLESYARRLVEKGEIVVISGSLPAKFPAHTYGRLVRLCNDAGKTVVLDTSGPALTEALADRPAVMKPNRTELGEILGNSPGTEEQTVAAIRKLAGSHDVVIVSDGSRGAYFCSDGNTYHGSAPDVAVVDTTGAGDALLGQFCSDYFGTSRRTLDDETIANSTAAGSACAELHGTPMLSRERIAELARAVVVREL